MQKKGFDEREYSFQEVERVERLFWEDFERLVTEELKKAALEKLRKAQYDQEGVVSDGSASRRKYQSTMRAISDGKSKTIERVLKLRAAMAAKEEEKKARLTMRDMQKSLEMEQRLAAQRRVQTGDSFLQKMERTRVTGKIREVILDKLASKVSAEKAKSDERERQAEIRLTALREMQSVRLAALKLASDTRANQVRSAKEAAEKQEKEALVKAIQEREKAYAASQLDVDVDLRARSALTCKAIEEKVANVVWVTNELLRQRVEKLTETMAIKEAQLARKQEQTRLEIDRKRAENMLRISNHQEAAEARRREGIQRREAIVKNKILREFALDQSKSKKEALLELRSEMGEALHQTKERLNEEVTRLQVCNKYSSEDVALAVREVAHRFLLPFLGKKLPRPLSSAIIPSVPLDQQLRPPLSAPTSSPPPTKASMFLPILKRESSSRTIAFECAEDRKLTPSIHSRSLSLERELRATTALPLKLFTAENVDALIEKFKKMYGAGEQPLTKPKLDRIASNSTETVKLKAVSATSPPKLAATTSARGADASGVICEAKEKTKEMTRSKFRSAVSRVIIANHVIKQMRQAKYHGVPIEADEFRKEFSEDHPLAGGKGRYDQEKKRGLRPLRPGRVSMGREEVQIEHTRQFQSYKADLDAFFGSVLEEEEVSEEARRTAELMNYEDEQERGMILRAIAEDRARASLRIKRIADENAAKLRAAMKHLVLEEADGMSWSLS